MAYLIGLCLLFLVRDYFEVALPFILFLVYFAFGYFVFDYEHALALSVTMPLLSHGVQTNYVILIAIVMQFFKYFHTISFNYVHVIILCLMMFELMHGFFASFSLSDYIRYFVQYFYIALIVGNNKIKQFLHEPMLVIRTFLGIAAYFMLDVMLVTSKYLDYGDMLSDGVRFGTLEEFIDLSKVPTLYDNENMVAMFALVALNLCVVCLYKTRRFWVLDSFLLVYFVFFGLLTNSRAFLLCLALSAVFHILYLFKNSIAKALVIMVVVLIIFAILGATVFSDVLENILKRFAEDDVTGGRGDLFGRVNDALFSNLAIFFFGTGLQATGALAGIEAPHNAIQETLLCWGVVGLVIVAAFIVIVIKNARKIAAQKIPLVYYSPFIMYAVFIQSIQFVRLPGIFGLLTLFFVTILAGAYNENEKELSNNG